MVAGGCPWMAGGQTRPTAPEAFLRVLKPAASPLRNPRSCRRMTGGWCARHPSVDPGGVAHGHHGCLWATLPGSISAWSSIPLVTPLRRDDQGLSSDEASGFTSCAACDRHFLIPNGSLHHDHIPMNRFGIKGPRPSA